MNLLLGTPYRTDSATGVGRLVGALFNWAKSEGQGSAVLEPGTRPDRRPVANIAFALRSAVRTIRIRRSVDLIHCHAVHMQSLALSIVGRILGKPVVLTIHGPSSPAEGGRRVLMAFLEWACTAFPDQVVLVAEFLHPLFPGSSVVINNGVPIRAIREFQPERQAIRAAHGFGDQVVFVYFGRITEDKGVRRLLSAHGILLADERIRSHLLLVGSLEPGSALAGEIARANGTTLIGPSEDRWKYLSAADAFVLPSEREGLPLTLLEAMAAGLAVIATPVGGIPEVLTGTGCGILVPLNDDDALLRAMRDLATNPDRREEMGLSAANLVNARYDESEMLERYRDLYRSLLD